jgi:hypothetical protein
MPLAQIPTHKIQKTIHALVNHPFTHQPVHQNIDSSTHIASYSSNQLHILQSVHRLIYLFSHSSNNSRTNPSIHLSINTLTHTPSNSQPIHKPLRYLLFVPPTSQSTHSQSQTGAVLKADKLEADKMFSVF